MAIPGVNTFSWLFPRLGVPAKPLPAVGLRGQEQNPDLTAWFRRTGGIGYLGGFGAILLVSGVAEGVFGGFGADFVDGGLSGWRTVSWILSVEALPWIHAVILRRLWRRGSARQRRYPGGQGSCAGARPQCIPTFVCV